MKKQFFGVVMLITVMAFFSGCGVVNSQVQDWNKGVALYNAGQSTYAKCMQTQFFRNQQFGLLFSANASYISGNVALSQKWAEGQSKSQELAEMQQKYQSALAAATNQQGTIDLDKLQKAGFTPQSVGSGLTIVVNSVVQAQAQINDPAVTIALMDSVNEGYNDINAKCLDYQNAAQAFNTWAGSAAQSVKLEVARRLGIDYLPGQLSYYTPAPVQFTPPTPMFAPTTAP